MKILAFVHSNQVRDDEPNWGEVDKTALPRAAFADQGEENKKSTWSYPHHWVKDGGNKDDNGVYTTGTMYLHQAGLNAAWSAANGGRSGQEASQAVKDHLQAHRRALGTEDVSRYRINAKAEGELEIYIYEEIGEGWFGGLSARQFAKDIEERGDTVTKITLHINSPGGDTFDGNAIYNILKQHKARVVVYVEGIAASIASIIAMAGDEIYIAENALMMVHNPWTYSIGYAEDLRKTADLLDKIRGTLVKTYARRTGLKEDKIVELMNAETWINSDEAIEMGFADETIESMPVAAHYDLSRFKYRNMPKSIAEAPAAFGRGRNTVFLNKPLPGAAGINQKDTAVKKSIKEQIGSFEAKRAANSARMKEIMGLSGDEGRTLTETEQQEFDGFVSQNKEIDEHLKRLREMERLDIANAAPIPTAAGESQAAGTQARTNPVVSVLGPNVKPGTGFVRYAMALMGAVIDKKRRTPLDLARSQSHWRDQTPQVERVLASNLDIPQVLNVAVEAGETHTTGWASELADYTYMASEFIEFLRPLTIIGKMTGLRPVPFNIRIPLQDAGSSVNWVGEGSPKPVSKLHFDTTTLRFAKAAGIVVITDELVRFSNPSAEALVRTDMANAIRQFLDEQFISPTVVAVANVNPASITNGAANSVASGTTADDLRNDIATALQALIAANIDPDGLRIIMRPTLAVQIMMMRNLLGQKEFPDINASGGMLEGYPVITSNSVPSGIMVFVKESEILLADDGGISVDASREASILMDDGVSPATTTTVSLFQSNMVALRVERIINWLRRRDAAVYYLTSCDYGAASPA
jgi:HK97 family phage major capsid protein